MGRGVPWIKRGGKIFGMQDVADVMKENQEENRHLGSPKDTKIGQVAANLPGMRRHCPACRKPGLRRNKPPGVLLPTAVAAFTPRVSTSSTLILRTDVSTSHHGQPLVLKSLCLSTHSVQPMPLFVRYLQCTPRILSVQALHMLGVENPT